MPSSPPRPGDLVPAPSAAYRRSDSTYTTAFQNRKPGRPPLLEPLPEHEDLNRLMMRNLKGDGVPYCQVCGLWHPLSEAADRHSERWMPPPEEVKFRLQWYKDGYSYIKLDDLDATRWEIIDEDNSMEFPLWSLQESEFYRETQHESSHWPTRDEFITTLRNSLTVDIVDIEISRDFVTIEERRRQASRCSSPPAGPAPPANGLVPSSSSQSSSVSQASNAVDHAFGFFSRAVATLFPSTDRTIPAVNNPNNASRHNTALQMCSAPSSSGPFPVNAATTSPIYTDHTCAHCSQSAVEIILLKRAERNLQDRLKSMEADLTRHKKQMEQDEEKIKKLEKEAVTNRTERGKQEKRNKDLEKTAATHKTEREEQVRQIQKLQKEATAYRTEREEQAKRIQGLESEAAAYKAEKESQIALLQAKIDLADRDKTIALQQLRLELSRPAQDSTRPESTTSASASPSWTTSACDLTSAAQPSPHQNGPRQLPHRYGPRPQPYRSGPRSHPHRFGPVKAKETVLANKDNAHKLELAAKEKDITAKNQEITAKETALANKDKAHKLELESMNNALESMKNANKVELLELRLELSTKDKRISVHDLQLRLRDNHIQMLKTELAKAHVDRPLPAPVPAPPPAAPAAPAPASIDESIAQDYAQDYEDYVHGAVQVQHLADVAQDEPSDLPRPEELISRLLDAAQARSLHGSTPATDRFFFETLAACIKDRDLIGSCRRAGRTRPLLGSAKQYTRLGSNTVDAILGIGVRTLEDWQPAGDGAVPAFVRLARLVISAENEIERQKREMEEEQRRAEAEQEEEEEEEEEMIE